MPASWLTPVERPNRKRRRWWNAPVTLPLWLFAAIMVSGTIEWLTAIHVL